MADEVAIDFARMSQLVEILGDADARITALLHELDESVSRLEGQWTGAASTAYHRAHTEWSISLSAMNGVLGQAKSTAGAINERHRAAETQVQDLWS
jgi:WXG100 family type VII secretion target